MISADEVIDFFDTPFIVLAKELLAEIAHLSV